MDATLRNLRLVIPTHKRLGRQLTLNSLPMELRKQTTLVASLPEEAKELKKRHPEVEVVCARGTDGIATKRHWIMQNLKGKPVIFMLDDDLWLFERCPTKWRVWTENCGNDRYKIAPNAPTGTSLMKRLYPSKKADAAKLIAGFKALDDRYAKHTPGGLAIAHRRLSDTIKDSWKLNQRIMFAFGVEVDSYKKLKIRFDAVRCREDFHVGLSLLRGGRPIHSYYELLNNDYASFRAAGGCADERTLELSNEQCFVLAKLHPGFVKVVDRAYTNTVQRKEVQVSWAKAYKSSGAK